jgi:hypothetical protein
MILNVLKIKLRSFLLKYSFYPRTKKSNIQGVVSCKFSIDMKHFYKISNAANAFMFIN